LPRQPFEAVGILKSLEGKFAPPSRLPRSAPVSTGGVDVHKGQCVLDHIAARSRRTGRLLNVTIRDLVERNCLANFTLVLAIQPAQSFVPLHDVLDAVPGDRNVLSANGILDVVLKDPRVDKAATKRKARPTVRNHSQYHHGVVFAKLIFKLVSLIWISGL